MPRKTYMKRGKLQTKEQKKVDFLCCQLNKAYMMF